MSLGAILAPGISAAYVENPLFDELDPSKGPTPLHPWDFTVTYLNEASSMDWSKKGSLSFHVDCAVAWQQTAGTRPRISTEDVLKYYVSYAPAAVRVVRQDTTGYHFVEQSCSAATLTPTAGGLDVQHSLAGSASPSAAPSVPAQDWTVYVPTGRTLVFAGTDPNSAQAHSRIVNHQSTRFATTAIGLGQTDPPFTGILVGDMPGLTFRTNAYLAGTPWGVFDPASQTTGSRVYDPTQTYDIMMFATTFHLTPTLLGPPAGTYEAALEVCDACE